MLNSAASAFPPAIMRVSKGKLLLLAFVVAVTQLHAADPAALLAQARSYPAMPRETADLIPFLGSLPTFASGAPFNDVLYTLIDTDYIDGENGGYDTFMPVDPSDAFPGADRVKLVRCALNTDLDVVYGAARGDRIILGTREHPRPFFLKGPDGVDNDYAVILHFDFVHGHIQLKGQPADYALIYGSRAEGCATDGWYLFYTADGAPDLIAFIFPCDVLVPAVSGNPPRNPNPYCNADRSLSLTNSAQFRYARALPSQPVVSAGIRQVGGSGKDLVLALAVDAQGNSYLVGNTDSNFDGGPEVGNEVFVAKIGAEGKVIWVRELPVGEGTNLKAVATDTEFVYVAGRTLGSLPGFTNAGRWDGILLKLRLSDGVIVAMDQWGNAGIDGYGNLVLDGAGHLFVSAQGSPSGPATTDNAYLVAKHRTSDLGNVWRMIDPIPVPGFAASAEAWGGLTFVPGTSPGEGRLIVAGWYMAISGADAFAAIYENLTSPTPTRPHFALLAATGQRADWILDSAVDAQGRITFVGYTTGNLQGTHQGEGDAFIVRYSPTLANPVIRQFGTPRSDLANSLEIDAEGNLHVLGYTYGNYDGGRNADPSGMTGDLFVQTFDANLNPIRSRQFGTPGEDRGFMKLRGDTLYLGGTTEGSLTGTNLGAFDGFVLTLDRRTFSVVPPAAPVTNPGRLINLSVRARLLDDGQPLIAGLGLGAGSGTRPLLLRAVGPTLELFGVGGFLANPAIEFGPFREPPVAVNDNWDGVPALADAFAAVGAFGFAAPESRDAALLHSTGAGLWTALVRGVGGPTGIAVVEVYDRGPATGPTLSNLSARSYVGGGEDALTAGFVVGGSTPQKLLVRATGPSLAGFGATGTLADPVLTLRPLGSEVVIAENDDWGGQAELKAAFASVGAFALAADSSRDAAVVLQLPPGGYTATVTGANRGVGLALVELYVLP